MLNMNFRVHLGGCCCGVVAAALAGLLRSAPDLNLTALYEELSDFLSHGQLIIEILPHLTLLLYRLPEGLLILLSYAGCLLQSAVLAWILGYVTQEGSESCWTSIISCLALNPTYRSGSGDVQSALAIGDSFGQSALLILFLFAIQDAPYAAGRVWISICLLLIAGLTCHDLVFVISMLAVYLAGFRTLFEQRRRLPSEPVRSEHLGFLISTRTDAYRYRTLAQCASYTGYPWLLF
jgi:hypothetical protein